MERVLFVCGHNSGRSQIAEAILEKLGGDDFEVKSGGLKPSDSVNPLVIEVMKEEGIDLSTKKPRGVFDFVKTGELFSYVVTVCDKDTDERCPVFPGIRRRANWPFPDPEKATGSHEEKLNQVRKIRDDIKTKLIDFFKLKA